MNLIIRPAAESDVLDAADYYDAVRLGLGAEFADEVDKVFNDITARPLAHAESADDVRFAVVDRFPYSV